MRLHETLSRHHLPGLDGLRAIAVGIVVVGHFDNRLGVGAGWSLDVNEYVGVLLFFVLSGFLITHLLLREHDAHGDVSFRRFYARRALRLLPAYYVFLAFAMVSSAVLGHPFPLGRALAATFYGANYWNALVQWDGDNPVYHLWSLAVEEQFYLLWPPLLLWLLQRRPAALAPTLVGIIAASAAGRCVQLALSPTDHLYAYNAFEMRVDNLALGCLLAVLVRDPRWAAGVERISAKAWMLVPPIAAVALSVWFGARSTWYRYGPGLTLEAIGCAVIMLQTLRLADTGPWRWLNTTPMVWVGRLSYSLYLWHGYGAVAENRLAGAPVAVQLLAYLGTGLALAAGSYYVIERPFLRMKERFAAGGARTSLVSAEVSLTPDSAGAPPSRDRRGGRPAARSRRSAVAIEA